MIARRAWLWLRSLVLRGRLEREMQEEMADHLERATARLMARGLSEVEARRQAVREFGNVPHLQEQARDARGGVWFDTLRADLRFALRHFARTPWTAATMFVVLAVGMCISSLVFSYVRSYAVQPPPGVVLEDDLVRIRGSRAAEGGRLSRPLSEDEFSAYGQLTDHFSTVAGWVDADALLDRGDAGAGNLLDGRATFVTGSYFPVLGVRPVLGPGLRAESGDGAALADGAVISHALWQRLFASDPRVIGSSITVNGVPVTVIGVAPPRFNGAGGGTSLQVWLPLVAWDAVMPQPPAEYRAVARLRPGVSHQAATAATAGVARRHARSAAESGDADALMSPVRELSADVVPLLSANADPIFDQNVRRMSLAGGLLALLVLLVTCTNVSALLTGLASARRQEIAIRLSLGAARGRLIRQLLTESALLATAAGVAALVIAWALLRAVATITFLPIELGLTRAATAFTFGVALAVGCLVGLSPALHATRLALADVLRDSTASIVRMRGRLQRGLVVAQIAFTQPLVVLIAAVLLLLLNEYQPPHNQADLADRLVRISVRTTIPPLTAAGEDFDPQAQLHAGTLRVLERLRATPGVTAAVVDWRRADGLGAYRAEDAGAAAGAPRAPVRLLGERVSEGNFGLHGVPVVRGRDFEAGDAVTIEARGGDVPAVVGGDLARRLWPGRDPIGRRLVAASDTAAAVPTLVVIGVIDDPVAEEQQTGDDYRIYLPPDPSGTAAALLVRTATPAAPLLPALRAAVLAEMPGAAPVLRTVADIWAEIDGRLRNIAMGVTIAGAIALLLSAIGLYAVIAFSVGERKREIAVRMAVGGRSGQIVRRFLTDGLRLGAIGLLVGLPVSVYGLYGVRSAVGDELGAVAIAPVTAIAAVGVVLVAAAAAWLPARRAATVDPATALRRA